MEQQLQQAIAKCQRETNQVQRQKSLNSLLMLIQQLPGIYQVKHQDYPEAYNRTLIWVCNNIDKFESKTDSIAQSLTIWINGYLKWRVRDLYIADNSYDPHRLYPSKDAQLDLIASIPDPSISLSLLDTKIAQIQAEQEQNKGQAIADYIRQDMGENLATIYPRKHPQCNCHCLALRLLLELPPDKVSEIARDLAVNNQTLYSHWKKKCLPLLQEISQSIGN